MVVLSVAICTKGGKALISRQFVEMTRIWIEGLLAAFPKLLGSDPKQHTYIETESVRYLYQPLDNLYILLITNRASNIIEDLETLKLLSKVIPDTIGSANNLSEEKISDKCFDLIFAFDEVITTGGYKEPITLAQIKSNLEMESHEEKLHIMIKQSKMESAKDQARDAAKAIRDRQREQQKYGLSSSMQGIGSSDHDSITTPSDFTTAPAVTPSPSFTSTSQKQTTTTKSIKSMSLVPKNKGKSLEEALAKEDKLQPVITNTKSNAIEAITPSAPVIQQPVMLSITETVSAKISREGVIESFEVKGSLSLTATNEESSYCSVKLKQNDINSFAFSTPPKVNKALYDKSGIIQLKSTNTGFPVARPVGVLKWTSLNGNDDMLPITVNCWPEEESKGHINVSIEYSINNKIELNDVIIHIPLGTSESPNIVSIDGNYKHNHSEHELIWDIGLIDSSNASGSLEFNINQKNLDSFFPITIEFQSNTLLCDIDIASVNHVNDNKAIQYGLVKEMSAKDYIIG